MAVCAQPGCATIVPSGRCQPHQRPTTRKGRIRGQHHKLYSTAPWRRFRLALLADEPLCRDCRTAGHLTLATEVHHPHKLEDGGAPFDRANTIPLCHACHSAHTIQGE